MLTPRRPAIGRSPSMPPPCADRSPSIPPVVGLLLVAGLLVAAALCATALCVAPAMAAAQTPPDPVAPPEPDRRPQVSRQHGVERVDEYAWLRQRDDPEVLAHLEAENRYAEAALAPLAPLTDLLFRETVSHFAASDLSVPERRGRYLYYLRRERDLDYPLFCRREGDMEAPEELLLDLNRLAEEGGRLRLGDLAVSPDHQLLAYSVDTTGAERYTVRIKRLAVEGGQGGGAGEGGELLPDRLEEVAKGLEWSADGSVLYYLRRDASERPAELWRHRLSTAGGGLSEGHDGGSRSPGSDDDDRLYREEDQAFHLSLDKSAGRRFILLTAASKTATAVWALDAGDPAARPVELIERRPGVRVTVEQRGDSFYFLTDEDAPGFKLLAAPVAEPAARAELVPHRAGVQIEELRAFARHLALLERAEGLPRVRIIELPAEGGERPADGGTAEQLIAEHLIGEHLIAEHLIQWPEPTYTVELKGRGEHDRGVLRLAYSSLVTPESIYDYHLDERRLELRKRTPVPGGFDPENYASERIAVTSTDGTAVPVSLVYRRDEKLAGGPRPCLLYAYGAYGTSTDPSFSPIFLPLLDRGFVYAVAHVRGGGELGAAWHRAGKLEAKPNSFDDFLAAAEGLIERGYTTSDRLAVMGASAGGMVVGAALNQRPELFAAAVAINPFVDVLNTMLDPAIPLTVTEYEEWGDPTEPGAFATIRSYSPYDNVAPRRYPELLILASYNDTRVGYWEAAKWAARLRRHTTGDGRILLTTDLGAGHGGATGRAAVLRQRVQVWAFLVDAVGLAAAAEEELPREGGGR